MVMESKKKWRLHLIRKGSAFFILTDINHHCKYAQAEMGRDIARAPLGFAWPKIDTTRFMEIVAASARTIVP